MHEAEFTGYEEAVGLFLAKNACLADSYPEVAAWEFYSDLYGGSPGWLEPRGQVSAGKPNAIFSTAYRKSRNLGVDADPWHRNLWVSNTLVFDGMDGLEAVLQDDSPDLLWTVASPVTYSGRNRTYDNAYHLWGMVIDLDGVGMGELGDLLYQIDNGVIPRPTYLVNSGHGLHVYYNFEEPIPMYPRLRDSLKALKKELTDVVWNKYTSYIPTEERQYQGLVQGYRAVGTRTKLGNKYKVTAFRTGVPMTLESLQQWAELERGVDFDEFNHVTLDEAREKWPAWYQARIVEGKPRKAFDFPREVYEAWLKRIDRGAFDGNRYNCIAVLFSLANRCEGVTFEEAMSDALDRVPRMNRLTRKTNNQFTEDDVLDATGYYSDEFRNIGLDAVYRMTKIRIKPNKRNGVKREWHLEDIRHKKATMKKRGKPFKNPEGRPKGSGTKEQLVKDYVASNPGASVSAIAKATGVSRTTVYKWLDESVDK